MIENEINSIFGKALDKRIADIRGWKPKHNIEKCNGKYFIRCDTCGQIGHGNCYGNGSGAIQIKCGENVACCDEVWIPEVSSDISSSWKLVEEMNEKNIYLCLYSDENGFHAAFSDTWSYYLGDSPSIKGKYLNYMNGTCASEAISRAYLLANR